MNSKSLNILFLASWYPSRVQPTLGNFVQKHAEAVALKSNVSVLYVCSDVNAIDNYEIVSSEINNVYTVNVYIKKTNFPLLKIWRYFKAHKLGYNHIKNRLGRIDIVHQNVLYPSGAFAFYLKRKFKIPYIITEHWTGYLAEKQKTISFFQTFISKIISKEAEAITTVTKDLEYAMQKYGLRGCYKTVNNVVDTNLFSLPANKIKNEKIKFLHISHLDDEHKNITGMLSAVQKLAAKRNDFEFWFVGDGEIKPYEEKTKQLGILNSAVFFDGTKTTAEVACLMQQSDCFVLFSNYENFPVVIVEAMACGLPVISSDVGGIKEHLTEQFGCLVKVKDEEGLLNALNQFIDKINNNEFDSSVISNYAKSNFSYEKIGDDFEKIYSEILN